MISKAEPRSVTPLDLPLVRRMIAHSLPLDVSAALTYGIRGLEDALLSALPLADLGAPTMVLRDGSTGYIGQFRHRTSETVARCTFLAPEPQEADAHEWMRLLEAMAFEAGRRGAHLLSAEVAEDHPAFLAFRMADFSVYSRQVILRREPGPVTNGNSHLLRPWRERDAITLNLLYANTVPRLLQQAEPLPGPEPCGLIYEREGQIDGYLVVTEGKSGIVIKPYFHPEVYDQAPAIILSALTYLPRARWLPVYLYARAYQDWLRGVLEQVEFEPWTHQALMVKYTVVRIRRQETSALAGLDASRLTPPVMDGPMQFTRQRADNTVFPCPVGAGVTVENGTNQTEPYETSNHR
ncbi:MAG: hypothetical protein JXJ20_10120 [Anaerolineae bacterium]|jgi:hypothetical protein|nr:hypothetical protein [Anaerolineae bacterium]